jgi:hypothetical protein
MTPTSDKPTIITSFPGQKVDQFLKENGRLPGENPQADAWMETARQHCRNEVYYRDLLVRIGEMFGDAGKTSDDGSVQQDVICAKVPELVRALITKGSA